MSFLFGVKFIYDNLQKTIFCPNNENEENA